MPPSDEQNADISGENLITKTCSPSCGQSISTSTPKRFLRYQSVFLGPFCREPALRRPPVVFSAYLAYFNEIPSLKNFFRISF